MLDFDLKPEGLKGQLKDCVGSIEKTLRLHEPKMAIFFGKIN
jgi:hypothetical protein